MVLKTAQSSLEQGQRLVVAGGFQGDLQDTAWYVESTGVLQPDPTLRHNSEETDTRVWRHVQQTTGSKCLVVSPDTDVYMIGLPLYHGENKDIIVQIDPYNKREVQYLHLTALITVLQNDPAQHYTYIPIPIHRQWV